MASLVSTIDYEMTYKYKDHSINKGNFLKKEQNEFFFEFIALRQLKMLANQTKCSRLEQRSIIKFLVVERYKPYEIYRRMCDVYGEACFDEKKKPYKWAKSFKEVQNNIQDKDKVKIEDISLGTTHKIGHDDLAFSKVSCHWVPKM